MKTKFFFCGVDLFLLLGVAGWLPTGFGINVFAWETNVFTWVETPQLAVCSLCDPWRVVLRWGEHFLQLFFADVTDSDENQICWFDSLAKFAWALCELTAIDEKPGHCRFFIPCCRRITCICGAGSSPHQMHQMHQNWTIRLCNFSSANSSCSA